VRPELDEPVRDSTHLHAQRKFDDSKEQTMSIWTADGSGSRARIGILTHDDTTVSESEFWTMAPEGVSVHAARVLFTDWTTFVGPPGADDAVTRLARLPLQSITFAVTIVSYLLGVSEEQKLVKRLESRSNGIPVLMPAVAAVAGFRALGAQRIALFHGPWYDDAADQKGAEYFKAHGFDVVHASHMEPAYQVPHPNVGLIDPAELYEWVHTQAPSNADAIFIAGNAFRSIGVIDALEEDLGLPVLTANQVALWYALRLANVGAQVDGYGDLFKTFTLRPESDAPPETAVPRSQPAPVAA
jgi:maleate isomerase